MSLSSVRTVRSPQDWMPHVTVATVVMRDGRYLLVEEYSEGIMHPVFNQPAGHVEMGESLVDAAIRETLEETGWLVKIHAFLGIYTYTPPMAPDSTYYRFCFLADTVQFTENPLDADILRTVWMTADELALTARARSPLVLQAIHDAEVGQAYPVDMIKEFPLTPLRSLQDNLC